MKKVTVVLTEHEQNAEYLLTDIYYGGYNHNNIDSPKDKILDIIAKIQSEEKLIIFEYNTHHKTEEFGDFVKGCKDYGDKDNNYRETICIGEDKIEEFRSAKLKKYQDDLDFQVNWLDTLKSNMPIVKVKNTWFGSKKPFSDNYHYIETIKTENLIEELKNKIKTFNDKIDTRIISIQSRKIIEYLDIYFYDNLVDKI